MVLTYHPLYNRSANSASGGGKEEYKGIKRESRILKVIADNARGVFKVERPRYTGRRIEILDGISLDGTRGEIRESVYTVRKTRIWVSIRIGFVY